MVAIPRLLRVSAAALLLAGCLGGCSSAIDHIPTWAGGLPQDVPDRPAVQPAYPAVHDMPPPRNDTVLNEAERKRLEDDLIAARERTERNIQTGTVPVSTSGTNHKP
jgi:hypothetical protein